MHRRNEVNTKSPFTKCIEVRFCIFQKYGTIKDEAWIQTEMEHVALDSTHAYITLSGPTYSDSFWKPSILLVPLFPLFLSHEIHVHLLALECVTFNNASPELSFTRLLHTM